MQHGSTPTATHLALLDPPRRQAEDQAFRVHQGPPGAGAGTRVPGAGAPGGMAAVGGGTADRLRHFRPEGQDAARADTTSRRTPATNPRLVSRRSWASRVERDGRQVQHGQGTLRRRSRDRATSFCRPFRRASDGHHKAALPLRTRRAGPSIARPKVDRDRLGNAEIRKRHRGRRKANIACFRFCSVGAAACSRGRPASEIEGPARSTSSMNQRRSPHGRTPSSSCRMPVSRDRSSAAPPVRFGARRRRRRRCRR